jgi:hypothetical protein
MIVGPNALVFVIFSYEDLLLVLLLFSTLLCYLGEMCDLARPSILLQVKFFYSIYNKNLIFIHIVNSRSRRLGGSSSSIAHLHGLIYTIILHLT